MAKISVNKEIAIDRISTIVETLLKSKILFQKFKKAEMIELFSNLMLKNRSPEQLMEMSNDQLTNIINDIMVVEAVSGTLNDLTPEEMKIFDAAVEGK